MAARRMMLPDYGSNTQCMNIDEEENTWLKEKSALLNFRNTEQ